MFFFLCYDSSAAAAAAATIAAVLFVADIEDDFYLLALSRALQLKFIFKQIFIHFVCIIVGYTMSVLLDTLCVCVCGGGFLFVHKL